MWTSYDNISQDSSEVGEELKEVLYLEGYDDTDEYTALCRVSIKCFLV